MKVFVSLSPKGEFKEVECAEGALIEELIENIGEELPYGVLLARVNNRFVRICEEVSEGSKIELLDMRNQAANLAYQTSLSLIYLKAIEDTIGRANVEIQNSINKGIYTMIKKKELISDEEVQKIYSRMKEIVDQNMKIEGESGAYRIGNFEAKLYGMTVPSAGYISRFELRKYRKGVLIRFPHTKNPNEMPEYVDEVKMYDAFGEATNWGKLMEVSYVSDLNEKVRNGSYKELIQISEALHEKKVAELAERIKTENKRIILIAGPSSSGKTTFANRLRIQLRVLGLKPMYLGTDDYFVEREFTPRDEHGEYNFEDLTALDIGLFNSNMNDLLEGKTVDLPSFDFITGHKTYGKRLTRISQDQPIIIEGIHALNDKLTELIPPEEKFKIYISPLTQLNIDEYNRIPTTEARMLRRMVRDYNFRGHSAKGTLNSWHKVRAGEDKNIFPFSNEADAFFNSVHLYEIAVLKKYAKPLLEEITEDEVEYGDAQRVLEFLSFFDVIEDDSMIAKNSILREFIGGSTLV